MKICDCPTFEIKIYIGTREGYLYQTPEEYELTRAKILNACQRYCNDVGLGLSFTETIYIYTNGQEPGFIIGLINYPRFPKSEFELLHHAEEIAKELIVIAKQERLSIVTSNYTYMLENNDD